MAGQKTPAKRANRGGLSLKARQRSNVYGLLASIFWKEPDERLAEFLKKDGGLNLVLSKGIKWEEGFWLQPFSKICEDLAVEYTRLFLGPKDHLPPFESLYQVKDGEARQIWGTPTVEVKKIIESVNLSFPRDGGGIPDHISLELEFMQKIVAKEAENWLKPKQNALLEKTLELEKKFLQGHLCRWIPGYCQRVMEAARLDFYRNFAKITRDFILDETREIENLLSLLGE